MIEIDFQNMPLFLQNGTFFPIPSCQKISLFLREMERFYLNFYYRTKEYHINLVSKDFLIQLIRIGNEKMQSFLDCSYNLEVAKHFLHPYHGLRGFLVPRGFAYTEVRVHRGYSYHATFLFLKTAYPRGNRVDRGYCYAICRFFTKKPRNCEVRVHRGKGVCL